MQFYPYYRQPDAREVADLIDSAQHCQLVTISSDGTPHVGLFNHHFDGGCFYLHLNRMDEQVADLRSTGRGLLTFLEFFATIPSYWVDPHDGGVATAYYRYAEFDCSVELIEDAEGMVEPLQTLMDRYQREGGYDPLHAHSPIYASSIARLVVVRCTPLATRTKWKLGQNKPVETRRAIIEKFRDRKGPNDERAALMVERSIAAEHTRTS